MDPLAPSLDPTLGLAAEGNVRVDYDLLWLYLIYFLLLNTVSQFVKVHNVIFRKKSYSQAGQEDQCALLHSYQSKKRLQNHTASTEFVVLLAHLEG